MSRITWMTVAFISYLLRVTHLSDKADEITAIQLNNSCYWLHHSPQDFDTANNICISADQELALFDGNVEFNEVGFCLDFYFKTREMKDMNVWINIIKNGSNSFHWKNEPFNMTSVWESGEPNENCKNIGTNKCCVRLKWESDVYKKLADHDSSYIFKFLCKHKVKETDANCTTKESSPLNIFVCPCGVGYRLSKDGISCERVDESEGSVKPCDQNCANTQGSFSCSCNGERQLNNDSKTCGDSDERVASNRPNCSQNCSNSHESCNCECYSGYNLTSDNATCRDIDECVSGPRQYQCNSTAGSYNCTCPAGHALSTNGTTCLDIDECQDGTNRCPGACTNTVGSYFCGCRLVYNNTKKLCAHVDECEDGQDNCSRTCQDGTNCSECYDGNITCQHNCISTNGSYYCTCNKGYSLGSDNRSCHDIDECQLNTTVCGHFCHNIEGSFACSCPIGYKLDKDGHSCVTNIKKCPCFCLFANKLTKTNVSALRQTLRKLITDLAVRSRNTSMFTRRKTCAGDKRGSPETVGSFGVAIVALVLVVIIVPDCIASVKYVVNRIWTKV